MPVFLFVWIIWSDVAHRKEPKKRSADKEIQDMSDTPLSASLEDYLEAIAERVDEHGHAHTRDIAHCLKVKMPSVTNALRILAGNGFIQYQPNQPVLLTERGMERAREILRRHHLFQDFFTCLLGLPEEESGEMACGMEHLVNRRVIQRLEILSEAIQQREDCQALRNYLKEVWEMEVSPNGSCPILLARLKPGDVAILVRIGRNVRRSGELFSQGFCLGTKIVMRQISPEEDFCECLVEGYVRTLSWEETQNIWVREV